MKYVALADVANIQLGKMLSPKAKTGAEAFPYLRNQNVQWRRFELSDMATMDFSARERSKFRLLPGDLLVCEGGEPGRCAVWDGRIDDCFYQKALHRLRPKSGVADPEFLALWIQFQALRGAFDDQNAKTTIAHLPLVRLEQLIVPDVPIEEQTRTAKALRVLLAEADKARQAAESQLRDAALLPSRIINEVFDGISGHPATLDDLLVEIQAGKSFQTAETLAGPDELGVLKVSAVTWTDFRPNEAKALSEAYEPAESHKVKSGDFIISRANTKEFVGAVVLVDKDFPNRLLSDKTLRLVVDESRVCKEYLIFALRTNMARRHIEHYATGTSDSMRNISQGTITSIPLCLPELNEQRIVATQLKAKLKEVAEIRSAIERQLQETKTLPNRILAQAFES